MVAVTLRERLGNNLFQYALGRIIASHHGLALDCRPGATRWWLQPPAETDKSTLDGLRAYFPNAPLSLGGERVPTPIQSFELGGNTGWNGQTLPLPAVLDDSTPRQIRLDGYFQRYEYFARHLDDLRRWFAMTPLAVSHIPGRDDILVHIRRDIDFGILGWTLPLSYYDEALTAMGRLGQIYLCGTGIDDRVLDHFRKYRATNLAGTPMEDFYSIGRFNRMVLSNSTFAWWAALLSHATEIYAPHAATQAGYAFTGFRDVDLHMRESRYHPLSVKDFLGVETTLHSNIVGAVLVVRESRAFVESPGLSSMPIDIEEGGLELAKLLLGRKVIVTSAIAQQFPRLNLKRLIPRFVRSGMAVVTCRYDE